MRAPGSFSPDDIVVGHSTRMRAIFDFVKVVSRSDSSVIITGESGTGKEVIANLLHHSSSRRHQPFVAVSCALFSENLIETELFGHERGAFTGAIKDKPGRFEMADGGTIFLDDIDDVPLSMQVKLLRAIQNRTVERVGGTRSISVNVRVITGSKRDLKKMVAEGNFREDLFYRLNVMSVELPPLRERKGDIAPLITHYIDAFNTEFRKKIRGVSPTTMTALEAYPWRGNVRELRNALERAMLLADGNELNESHFPMLTSGESELSTAMGLPIEGINLEALERSLVVQALERSGWNQTKAATLLGLNRDQIRYRIEKFDLHKPQS